MKSLLPLLVLGQLGMASLLFAQARHEVRIIITDESGAKTLPCRIHLKDKDGKPVKADKLPFWHDHFVCPGAVRLELAPGQYSYEIERGPEYQHLNGSFACDSAMHYTLQLRRLVNLADEGWWSGELHVHRPLEEMELLMQAEDLHVAPVITWWNNRNLWADRKIPDPLLVTFDGDRFYHVMGGEDEREGGALLYFNLKQPLAIMGAKREHPSPMQFLAQARKQDRVWVDIEKPFWWDAPIWLASGQVDSIGIANNHMCRSQMLENEAWGKPRDVQRLPPPRGNGFWTQEIYYHLLNCGLRLPPSAGSASGVLPNPVGYNRVYVHLGKNLDYAQWWEGLRAGRSFVSNGPLLRCQANGQFPGHVFSGPAGKPLEIELKASLSSQDRIASIEIIQNGRLQRAIPFQEWWQTGTLGSLTFAESGWFLVRVIADYPKTFRFASTAPYYVEIGDAKRRISKASAQFFLDWVRERRRRVKLDDPEQRAEVLQHHDLAEKFWAQRLGQANAE